MEEYAMNSPKSSDSLDEELEDITDWGHAPNIDGEGNKGLCQVELVGHAGNSDEDTEDASEDGDNNMTMAMKEQMYFHKLALLKARLEELKYERHPAFVRGLAKIEEQRAERLRNNEAWRQHEASCIEREFMLEKKMAVQEFEEKKNELRDRLVNEWEEKKRQVEQDRYSIELSNDNVETKPSTRKLRRRPNDPVPSPEVKRRKSPQTQLAFLLDDNHIEQDVETVSNVMGNTGITTSWRKKNEPAVTAVDNSSCIADSTAAEGVSTFVDSRIEDGKLFYEKKWFHRGQTVLVEGVDMPYKISGVISSISQDTIWIRKFADQTKFRVMLSQLIKGTCAIKRRP